MSGYRAQLSAVCEEHRQLQSQEPALKENHEHSHGTDNRFAQPAALCQTTETFMGTQKATGAVSLEEKRVPAEPSSLEPGQTLCSALSQHCFPCFCPSSSCQLWQRRILHPSAVDVCRDLSLFAQLEASPTAVSQPKPIYI